MVKSATLQLIEAAERLNMSGEIGDGTVARFHELAALARLEQQPVTVDLPGVTTREQAIRRAHWDFDQAQRRRQSRSLR